MSDIKTKCRIEGDCLIWTGAVDKQSGHAVSRIEGYKQIIYVATNYVCVETTGELLYLRWVTLKGMYYFFSL
jgi:hypothetical protein